MQDNVWSGIFWRDNISFLAGMPEETHEYTFALQQQSTYLNT